MRKISNMIAFPTIFIVLLYTGFWRETIVAFWLLALFLRLSFYREKANLYTIKFGGGDIKLFMLIAALKGWVFIPIFILTFGLIKIYRVLHNYRLGLPVTPFALTSFLLFQLTITIFAKMVGMAV